MSTIAATAATVRARTRRTPSMFSAPLLAVVSLGLLMYGASEADAALGVVCVVAAGAGWWLTERRGSGLPRWASASLVVGVAIAAVYRASQTQSFVSTFTGFLAALMVVKLWERRRARDYGQLLAMSVCLSIAATLNDNGLGVGVLLLVQAAALVYAVMVFHVEIPARREGEARSGVSPVQPAGVKRAVGAQAALVVVAGGALSVVVFVLVPRGIGKDGFGDFGRTAARQTGFSDRIELGKAGLISQSQATVLGVQMRDSSGMIRGGPSEVFYLRGAVLDTYDGGTWHSRSGGEDGRELGAGQREGLLWLDRNTRVLEQRYHLRNSGAETTIFTVLRPAWITWDSDGRLVRNSLTGTLVRRGTGGALRYAVGSVVALPTVDESARRRGAFSFPSARVAGKARELLVAAGMQPDPAVRPVTEDAAAARVFETYLRTNFSYTLDIAAPPPGVDPTEWFIFEEGRGHCEYFASALAGLCRAVGINARVVTGYMASEYDASRDEYVVRRSHAHAWVEVNSGAGRWSTFDATPQAQVRALHAGRASITTRVARWLDGIESLWASAIVGYDSRAQERVYGRRGGGGRGSALDRAASSLRGWLGGEGEGDAGGGRSGAWGKRIGGAAVGGALIAGAVVLWRLARRPLRRAGTAGARRAPHGLGDVQEALLSALEREGIRRPPSMPLMTFARGVRESGHRLGGVAVDIAGEVYAACFAGRGVSAAAVRNLRQRVRAVARG